MAIPLLAFSNNPIAPTASPVQSLDSVINAVISGINAGNASPSIASSVAQGVIGGAKTASALEAQGAQTEVNRAQAELLKTKLEAAKVTDVNGVTLATLQARAELEKAKADAQKYEEFQIIQQQQDELLDFSKSGDREIRRTGFTDPTYTKALSDSEFRRAYTNSAIQRGDLNAEEIAILKNKEAAEAYQELAGVTEAQIQKNQDNAYSKVANEAYAPSLVKGAGYDDFTAGLARAEVVPSGQYEFDEQGNIKLENGQRKINQSTLDPTTGQPRKGGYDVLINGKKASPTPITDKEEADRLTFAIEAARRAVLSNPATRAEYEADLAGRDQPTSSPDSSLIGASGRLTPEATAKLQSLVTKSPPAIQGTIQQRIQSVQKQFSVPVATPVPTPPAPKEFTPTSYVAERPAQAKGIKTIKESPILNQLPLIDKAIVAIESGGNLNAISPTGVVGAMQVTRAAATDVEKAEKLPAGSLNVNNTQDNLYTGMKYYRGLVKQFKNPVLALAAYNGGMGNISVAVSRAGSSDWKIVKEYLPEVLTAWYTRNLPKGSNVAQAVRGKMKELRDYPERVIAQLPHLAEQNTQDYQILEYFKNLGYLKRG